MNDCDCNFEICLTSKLLMSLQESNLEALRDKNIKGYARICTSECKRWWRAPVNQFTLEAQTSTAVDDPEGQKTVYVAQPASFASVH
jgi:hypothetical protein